VKREAARGARAADLRADGRSVAEQPRKPSDVDDHEPRVEDFNAGRELTRQHPKRSAVIIAITGASRSRKGRMVDACK
jgi:hypothetical protein